MKFLYKNCLKTPTNVSIVLLMIFYEMLFVADQLLLSFGIEIVQGKYDISILMWLFIALTVGATSVAIMAFVEIAKKKSSENTAIELRRKILHNYYNQNSYDSSGSGEILSIIVNEVESTSELFAYHYAKLFEQVMRITVSLAICFFISPTATMVLIVTVVPSVVITQFFNGKIELQSRKRAKVIGSISQFLIETLQSVAEIKVFNLFDKNSEKFHELNIEKATSSVELSKTRGKQFYISNFLGYIPIFAVLGTVCVLLVNNTLSLAEVFAFTSLAESGIIWTVCDIPTYMGNIAEQKGLMKRAEPYLHDAEEFLTDEKIHFEPIANLSVKDISYEIEGRKILSNVNMEIKSNSLTCIVGSSGSGKTTLLNIIIGFLEPNEGNIILNGKKINNLVNEISYVPQGKSIFLGSIKENIALGKKGASIEEITEAAKKANAHDFIMSMPDGYDTIVGDGEINLSIGQYQRLGIARGLINNRPILILDEPTSSLDIDSEKAIINALEVIKKERTCICVTHRAGLSNSADVVYELSNERLVTANA